MGGHADREDLQAALLQRGADQVDQLPAVGHVDLVQDGDAQPAHQVQLLAAVLAQLVLQRHDVALRVAPGLHGGHVDDVHQHRAPLDVPEELQAEALAGGGTGDQPGDVGHRVGDVAGADDAQLRHERGERVVGDLRAGRGHGGDQRGLAGRGVPDQTDVGDALELQHGVDGLTGLTEQGEAGGLAAGVGQRGVAEAALATLGEDEPGAGAHQVADDLTTHGDHGARRDLEHALLAATTVLVVTGGLPAVAGLLVRGVVEVQQRVHVGVDLEDDVTAVATVAAVGPTEGLELLAVHGADPVRPVARGHVDGHTVDESGHGRRLSLGRTLFPSALVPRAEPCERGGNGKRVAAPMSAPPPAQYWLASLAGRPVLTRRRSRGRRRPAPRQR